jgi:hypothetical protein
MEVELPANDVEFRVFCGLIWVWRLIFRERKTMLLLACSKD